MHILCLMILQKQHVAANVTHPEIYGLKCLSQGNLFLFFLSHLLVCFVTFYNHLYCSGIIVRSV